MSALQLALSISAKAVASPTMVPSLDDPKLFARTHKLEAGVHVHWALPDALTSARLDPKFGDAAFFPGVPDLWLVTRFSPPTTKPQRNWRAWIVDSRKGTVTAQGTWQPPQTGDKKVIHTAVGLLPSAETEGLPGWGRLEGQNSFDPLRIAYYPACRTRFGLHDPLDDLAKKNVLVSYSVVGWYWTPEHDPLSMAANRLKLLASWKLAYDDEPALSGMTEIGAAVGAAGPAVGWKPASMQLNPASKAPASILNAQRFSPATGVAAARARRVGAMAKLVATERSTVMRGCAVRRGPSEIRCHGAVTSVDLSLPGVAPAAMTDKQVRVYPTVHRAMADIVSVTDASDAEIEQLQALLGSLEHQTGTLAGMIDLPGANHALSFQGLPGQSHAYARIDVESASRPVSANKMLMLGPTPNVGDKGVGFWSAMNTPSASSTQHTAVSASEPNLIFKPAPAKPKGPDDVEIAAWVKRVLDAFEAVKAARPSVDARYIRVQDSRPDAQSLNLGPMAPGQGIDGASSWLDTSDPALLHDALVALLKATSGAVVHLPSASRIYEEPGPRWYRPWSPQLVLLGAGRSFRFGDDDRHRADGYVDVRVSGETVSGLTIGSGGTVSGVELLDAAERLFATGGLPPEARTLIGEMLLLDPASAQSMASIIVARPASKGIDAKALESRCRSAVLSLSLARDRAFAADNGSAMSNVLVHGVRPSPIAGTPWSDPRDPLFVNVDYAHPHSSLAVDWQLEPDHVECTPKKTLRRVSARRTCRRRATSSATPSAFQSPRPCSRSSRARSSRR